MHAQQERIVVGAHHEHHAQRRHFNTAAAGLSHQRGFHFFGLHPFFQMLEGVIDFLNQRERLNIGFERRTTQILFQCLLDFFLVLNRSFFDFLELPNSPLIAAGGAALEKCALFLHGLMGPILFPCGCLLNRCAVCGTHQLSPVFNIVMYLKSPYIILQLPVILNGLNSPIVQKIRAKG